MTTPTLVGLNPEGSLKSQRTAAGVDALAHSFLDNLFFVQGRSRDRATVNDLYMALAHAVRDRLVERWIQTVLNYRAQDVRVVCYLSAEFLTGPHLANNLINLGIHEEGAKKRCASLGIDLVRCWSNRRQNPASATAVSDGWPPAFWTRWPRWTSRLSATESATSTASSVRKSWRLADRSARQLAPLRQSLGDRAARSASTKSSFGGASSEIHRQHGRHGARMGRPPTTCLGDAVRHARPGYRNNTVNTLRLWSATGRRTIRISRSSTAATTSGPSRRSSRPRTSRRSFTRTTSSLRGKELRLKQQYFFVSASLQDMVRAIQQYHDRSATDLHEQGRHPDERHAPGHRGRRADAPAGRRSTACLGTRLGIAHATLLRYTNHTLMPEALERWPVWLC